MLLLSAIDEELMLLSSSNASLDVYASFNDIAMPNLTFPQPKSVAFNVVSPETNSLGGPPAEFFIRQYKSIYIVNRHPSSNVDVTFLFRKGTNEYQIKKYTLAPSQHASYLEGVGFMRYNADGAAQAPV